MNSQSKISEFVYYILHRFFIFYEPKYLYLRNFSYFFGYNEYLSVILDNTNTGTSKKLPMTSYEYELIRLSEVIDGAFDTDFEYLFLYTENILFLKNTKYLENIKVAVYVNTDLSLRYRLGNFFDNFRYLTNKYNDSFQKVSHISINAEERSLGFLYSNPLAIYFAEEYSMYSIFLRISGILFSFFLIFSILYTIGLYELEAFTLYFLEPISTFFREFFEIFGSKWYRSFLCTFFFIHPHFLSIFPDYVNFGRNFFIDLTCMDAVDLFCLPIIGFDVEWLASEGPQLMPNLYETLKAGIYILRFDLLKTNMFLLYKETFFFFIIFWLSFLFFFLHYVYGLGHMILLNNLNKTLNKKYFLFNVLFFNLALFFFCIFFIFMYYFNYSLSDFIEYPCFCDICHNISDGQIGPIHKYILIRI